jgi:hypothetical protein
MARMTGWVRRYADEGRLQKLFWLVLISGAIALTEWSLSPFPHNLVSDAHHFGLLLLLAGLWTVVVAVGVFMCGWPALVMLAFIKWGLLPVYRLGLLYWACAVYNSCP